MGLTVRWNEILTPTPKENAEMQVLKAQKDVALVNAGIISPDEARKRLQSDEASEYTEIPDEREDLDDFDTYADEDNPGNATNSALGKLKDGLRGVQRGTEVSPYSATTATTAVNNGGAEG